MTVCTNDLALGNLVEHVLPRPILKSLRDREFLVAKMVELEHDRIALPAVDAGMLAQEGDDVVGALGDELQLPSSR